MEKREGAEPLGDYNSQQTLRAQHACAVGPPGTTTPSSLCGRARMRRRPPLPLPLSSSPLSLPVAAAMFLQCYYNERGERVYTLKKLSPAGTPTFSAHPARFSPDDRFSRHRLVLKRRFGVLLTQQPRPLL